MRHLKTNFHQSLQQADISVNSGSILTRNSSCTTVLRGDLHQSLQQADISVNSGNILTRKSTRAIVLRGDHILLLYTKRYHDYSLPGGGVDENESIKAGFIRELQEETGAQEITNIKEFGLYDEYRPWYKDNFNIIHILSYCFTCEIASQLGETKFESYEVTNGMQPVWIKVDDAIAHNLETIANSDKKGLSIERETFLLQLIKKELL